MIYIKAGISGIQEFIFNISSKGAAKGLRTRSFFIEMTVNASWVYLESKMKGIQMVYNAGGNFIVKIEETSFEEQNYNHILETLKAAFGLYNLKFSMGYIRSHANMPYNEILAGLNTEVYSQRYLLGELTEFNSQVDEIKGEGNQLVETLTDCLKNNKSYDIKIVGNNSPILFLKKLNLELEFSSSEQKTFKINVNIPTNEHGEVLGFDAFADYAKKRTGTGKLGILKLDVDNLGNLMQVVKTEQDSKNMSDKLSSFFNIELKSLLEKPYQYNFRKKGEMRVALDSYAKNIYSVYIGGDDCFLIGAWDMLLDFVIKLRERFKAVMSKYKEQNTWITKELSFSAGYVLVEAGFPVVKFAEVVEEALYKAKSYSNEKDAFYLMGTVFKWDLIEHIVDVKTCFLKMILQYDYNRAFLHKFINLFEPNEVLEWQRLDPPKPFNPAVLWRFKYIMRDYIKTKIPVEVGVYQNEFFDINNTFFQKKNNLYTQYLFNSFKNGDNLFNVIPIASRWTEFLTKSINEYE